jgi:Mrp family chromosome partitioning ATPase
MRRSKIQNSAAMDSPAVPVSQNNTETAYAMRGGILFTQAGMVMLAAILLPIPPVMIDILLAVNFVFTAMLIFVVLAAREPAEITSVPPVVIFITLLRLGTNVAAAKSVLLIANGGRILDWCGTHIYYGFTGIAAAAILVPLICVIICKAAIFIRRKAVGYLVETIPNRQAAMEAEFQNGTLIYDQMLRAKNRIEKQTKFFASIASTSSLLLCEGVIALIITLATIAAAIVMGFINAPTIIADSQQYSPFAMAIAAATAIPAVLVALSLRVFINKRFLLVLKLQTPKVQSIHIDEPTETIPTENDTAVAIISPALDAVETELLPEEPPSFAIDEVADPTQIPEQELDNIITDDIPFEQPAIEEVETEAESQIIEPPTEELLDTPMPAEEFTDEPQTVQQEIELPVIDEVKEQPAATEIVRDDYYYDSILATIGDKSKASMLLAGESVSQLPITTAVELAIHIIQAGKRCLLIDMDPTRNAVATAFEIDSSSMQGKAVPTGIAHLWISPADDPDNPTAVKLARKAANALKVFDYVVIYAPNAAEQNVQDQLAGVSDAAIIFGTSEETARLEEFSKTLDLWGCRIVLEQDLLKKNA